MVFSPTILDSKNVAIVNEHHEMEMYTQSIDNIRKYSLYYSIKKKV